jgi:dethiobiotin synthetase
MSVVFVAGTDTDIGKTRVAVLLLQELAHSGCRATGFKPVAAGIEAGEICNADVHALMQAGSVRLSLRQHNPYGLVAPLSPHRAAFLEGRVLVWPTIQAAFEALQKHSDCVVVEGAGGWRVPLASDLDVADLPRLAAWPVLLVVGVRLGCINHARLTLEAMRADGVEVCGWVANCLADHSSLIGMIDDLEALLPVPHLATLAWQGNALAWSDAGRQWFAGFWGAAKDLANSV